MKVKNKRNGNIVHEKVTIADTFEKKTRGLIDAIQGDAMMFDTRWGIHTFGMKFPIDCAICDDSGEIKVIKTKIERNKFFFWNPKYRNVFEFPAGTLEKTQTEVGDILEAE